MIYTDRVSSHRVVRINALAVVNGWGGRIGRTRVRSLAITLHRHQDILVDAVLLQANKLVGRKIELVLRASDLIDDDIGRQTGLHHRYHRIVIQHLASVLPGDALDHDDWKHDESTQADNTKRFH